VFPILRVHCSSDACWELIFYHSLRLRWVFKSWSTVALMICLHFPILVRMVILQRPVHGCLNDVKVASRLSPSCRILMICCSWLPL
jgi:hypothetical protein